MSTWRNGGTAATPLRFAPRKNGLSGPVLTGPAAAWMIRTPVHNRFSNQAWGTSVANHGRRRCSACETVLSPMLITVLTSRGVAAVPPLHCHVGWAGEPDGRRL